MSPQVSPDHFYYHFVSKYPYCSIIFQVHEETNFSHGDIWTMPPSQASFEPSLLESQEFQQGSKLTIILVSLSTVKLHQ